MTVLTLDLGTTATKAAVWNDEGMPAIGRAELRTDHPAPDRAEQDPREWWQSAVDACGALRTQSFEAFEAFEAIDTIGFAAARQTFALFDADLRPLGPGVLWSDQRGAAQAADLGDPGEFRARTGVVLDGACCAAKAAWVAEHEPKAFAAARWILAPRDYVAARLIGEVSTDDTLASRTGFYDLDGHSVVAREPIASRLPHLVPSSTPFDVASGTTLAELGISRPVTVVLGAGDRSCEVLGCGGTTVTPMVSWGTTTNLSVPHAGPRGALPEVASVSRAALGGFLVEAGLSAGGAAIGWLARLTRRPAEVLLAEAAASPPGADGVVAMPWLHGARAPWWVPDARGAFVGLSAAHEAGDLARAIVEAVALDVARCLELVAPGSEALMLAGGGAGSALWREVLAGMTNHPVVRRRYDDAASVGARLIIGAASGDLGIPSSLDVWNPVVEVDQPDPSLVERYLPIRTASDAVVRRILPNLG